MHLAAVKDVYLSSRSVTSLLQGDFSGLTTLENLSLSNNQISVLPENVFDGLTELISLRMHNNQISALPEDVFDDLTALDTLFLHNNQISALPADVFDGLTALEDLRLHDNQIGALPEDVFDGLTALTDLNLSNNQISALPEDVFDDLTALDALSLHSNQISVLPENVFDGLTSLGDRINLNSNQISALPAGVFDGLTELERLRLQDNQISALPADVFDGLTALIALQLDNNQIETLPNCVFCGLSKLEYVNLEGNSPGGVSDEDFELPVTLMTDGAGEFKVAMAHGAPYTIVVPVSAANGSIAGGVSTVELTAGASGSGPVSVTRTLGTTAAVTVDIGTLPAVPSGAGNGYTLVKPDTGLPLEIYPAAATPVAAGTIPAVSVAVGAAHYLGAAPYFTGAVDTYAASSSDDTTATVAVTGSTVTVTGVAERTAMITVTATNDDGSAQQTFMVTVKRLFAPENLTAVWTGSGLGLEWDAVTNADSYVVQWKSGGEAYDEATRQADAAGASHVIAGLTAGTSYTLRVAAVDNIGDGPWSDEVTTPATPASTVTIAGGISVDEGAPYSGERQSALGYTLTFSPAITEPVTVYYSSVRAGSTARYGQDFTYRSERVLDSGELFDALKIPETPPAVSAPVAALEIDASPGSPVTTAHIVMTIRGDSVHEPDETVQVRLLGATIEATNTIVNDDEPAEIIVIQPRPIFEGHMINMEVRLSAPSETEITLDYEVLDTSTAVPGGSGAGDYPLNALPGGTLTFAPHATVQTLNIWAKADDLVEGDETINLRFSNPVGAELRGADGSGNVDVTAIILDEDSIPLVTITGGPPVAVGDSAQFTVIADPAPTTDMVVNLFITATSGYVDAANLGSKSVTIPANQATATYSVATINDVVSEPRGTVAATLASGDRYTRGSPNTAAVIVGELAPAVIVSEAVLTVAENGGTASYTIKLNSPPPANVRVEIGVTGHTGAVRVTPRDLNFSPTTWNSARTFTITGIDDAIDNPNDRRAVTITHTVEAWMVNAERGGVYDEISVNSVFVIVTDDDGVTPVITIAAGTSPVTEGTAATFTVTASPVPTANLDVGLTIDQSGDYVAVGDLGLGKTVTILANAATATYAVATIADTVDEPNCTVTASLAAGTGYTLGSPSMATVNVNDDDAAPGALPVLSVNAPTVVEGDSGRTEMTFTVTLTPASSEQVTVRFIPNPPITTAHSGTTTNPATDPLPDSDDDVLHTYISFTTLTFAPTETEKTFSVWVIGDQRDEDDETMGFILDSPVNATLATRDVTGTITDDDTRGLTLVTVPATTAPNHALSVTENGGTATYTVVLDTEPTDTVTVTPGSLNASVASVSGALTFTTGNWDTPQTVTVTGGDNTDETQVTLWHAVAGGDYEALPNPPSVSVTVNDAGATVPDAPAAPTFRTPTASSLVVNWAEPANTGGSAITSYDLQYRVANTSDVFTSIPDQTGTTATIGSLSANTAYEVQARATNATGDSPWSASAYGSTTVDGAVFSGTMIVGTTTGGGITSRGYRVITYGSLTPDSLNVGGADRFLEQLFDTEPNNELRVRFNIVNFDNVLPGSYNLRLDNAFFLLNSASYGADSSEPTYYVVPNANIVWTDGQAVAVSLVAVPAPGTTGTIPAASVAVGDTHVVNAATYFTGTVDTYTASSSDDARATVAVSGSTVTVTGVAVGTATITVTAANTGGSVEQTFDVTVTAAGSGPPDAPAAPTFGTPTASSLVVNWTAPPRGGSAITSYDLQYRVANTSDVFISIPNQAGTTATIGGLTANTAYEVQARATNSLGDSDWSASGYGSTTVDDAVFSATMIVGTHAGPAITRWGYAVLTYGSLTPYQFNDGTANRSFLNVADTDPANLLFVQFNNPGSGASLPGSYILRLDNASFLLDSSSYGADSSAVGDYAFPNANIVWTDGQAVAVSLAPAPDVTITIAAGPDVTEGAAATFTVTASPAPTANLDVSLTIGHTWDYAAAGDLGSKTVTIMANQATAIHAVATIDDTVHEPDGSVTATVTAGSGYTLGSTATASVTVTNNDAAPTLTIAGPRVTEGDSGTTTIMNFTVTASGATLYHVGCWTQEVARTSTQGTDYVARNTITEGANLLFPDPSQLSRTFAVTVNGDDAEEVNEPIRVRCIFVGLPGSTYLVQADGLIIDDDAVGDYDTDNDNLIEIANLAQLNAMRWDLDGNGAPTSDGSFSYGLAFPNAVTNMGCPGTCLGYELTADLDLDTDGSGTANAADDYWYGGRGWIPIGTLTGSYAGALHGNGHTISNLFINRVTAQVRLFGVLGGTGFVHHVGLLDVNITTTMHDVGALVGFMYGGNTRVAASYVNGGSVTGAGQTEGLVGSNQGKVAASWTNVAVAGTSQVGGILGHQSGNIASAFATGTVSGTGASVHGVVGFTVGSTAQLTAVYYNEDIHQVSDPAYSRSTAELKGGDGYTDIYASWNVDVDGVAGNDNPWDFGTGGEYPALKADRDGNGTFTWQEFGLQGRAARDVDRLRATDYDTDDDNLIEVTTLAQLDAMRYDLDGNGSVQAYTKHPAETVQLTRAQAVAKYIAAFPDADIAGDDRMGCPGTCEGYELMADLDFDTNNDGVTNVVGDAYWRDGKGWLPIDAAPLASCYTADFEGNYHSISNMFIKEAVGLNYSGLFGRLSGGEIRNVGLLNGGMNVTGDDNGLLVGYVGTCTAHNLGINDAGTITNSYATSAITNTLAYRSGGLVGSTAGMVRSSWASVTQWGDGDDHSGLVGLNYGTIDASYSTGRIQTFAHNRGGLVSPRSVGSVANSYYQVESNPGGQRRTAAQLQNPTGYTGIYANWNLDLDGDGTGDNPWYFGISTDYPTHSGLPSTPTDAPAAPAAPTFGTPTASSIVVNWTPPASGPAITGYDVRYREDDAGGVFTSIQDQSGTTATITGLSSPNTAYEVQARATNAIGDSPWSASGFGSTTVANAIFSATMIAGTATNSGITNWGYISASLGFGSLTPDGFNDGAADRFFNHLIDS